MIPRETAIVFIEFQNDFCRENGKLYRLVESELKRNHTIENGVRLLRNARAGGYKIVHCPFTLDRSWVIQHECSGILRNILTGDIFAPGSWGHEIIDEMKPIDGETVLQGKCTLSGFAHTNLEQLLRNSGIRNVVVCGFLTNVCVQATAWSAYDAGFQVRIVPEACASASQDIQRYVEDQIVPIVGGAMSVDDFSV